jgi:cytochrome c-type biogenesis protein CcmH/NrfF
VKRHALDLVSLVPGLVFVVVGIVSLTGTLDVQRIDYMWVWPAIAIVLGIILLASLLRRGDSQSSGSRSSDTEFMQ